jgi:hypothetical protein
MPRFLYWTILVGDQPTAFRAREAADLRPTLVQLQRTHPEARMRWFERGRLWASPDEARAAREAERRTPHKRSSTWRPGGRHEDPRQRFKDAKKEKWARFKNRIRARHEARTDGGTAPGAPHADRARPSRSGHPHVKGRSGARPSGARAAGQPASSSPRRPRKPRKR